MHDVLSLILGGGRGARLYPLTKRRSEPAVPLAGKYRLIDVPISNCFNSDLDRVYVLTQFLSVSLHRHLANTYKGDPFHLRFVEVLAAQQTNETADWYAGTASALRQNLRYPQEHGSRDVLVLSGDQLYRLDFRQMVETHRSSNADVTIAVVPVRRERARALGVVRLDDDRRVTRLIEKPQTDDELAGLATPPDWLAARGIDADGREHLANMGIYLFRRTVLEGLLCAHPKANDLVREVLMPAQATHRIQAFLFDGYWEDLGTIKSYFDAHLALAGDRPPFDFHSPDGVVYTRMRYLPASRVQASRVESCLISDGCVIGPGTELQRCVVGVRSRIGRDVTMHETVMNGADRYEAEVELHERRKPGTPELGVGDGSVIRRAILDKDCRIGRNVRIVNERGLVDHEEEHYVIRDGIVVIPNGTVIPDGTVI